MTTASPCGPPPPPAASSSLPSRAPSPITSPDLERASAAALEHTGGGRVTGTEIEDEESYYEVEVKLENGSVVDVQLDRSFTVVGQDADSDVADS